MSKFNNFKHITCTCNIFVCELRAGRRINRPTCNSDRPNNDSLCSVQNATAPDSVYLIILVLDL